MLSTTIVHACLRCDSEHIRKNGHADNGAQRAKCLDCGRTFILQPKGARYDQKFKDQVTAAYQDRMPFPPELTAPAAKRKGKPTTWNAGLARCERG